MATSDLLITVDAYTSEQTDLTNQMSDIVNQINRASKSSLSLLQQTDDERNAVKAQYKSGTSQYEDAMTDIDHEYQYELAKINEWETELETKKENLQTQIQATSAYKESFQSALKQNDSTDYKYGGNGGSS